VRRDERGSCEKQEKVPTTTTQQKKKRESARRSERAIAMKIIAGFETE
jgi:hypothetical protein